MRSLQTVRVLFFGFMLVAIIVTQTGCSVFMAASQPTKKNLEVLNKGTDRNYVLAELGSPVSTETKYGKKVDVFSFKQGSSTGAKVGRALFHGTADFFSFGLWEVVGTPTEAVISGKKLAFEVMYDENDRVEKVLALKK